MKKFLFSLQKLLNYKEQVLSKEKNDLASLRRELLNIIQSRDELIQRLREADGDFREKAEKGMSPSQMAFAKGYIKNLSDRIKECGDKISLLEKSIEKQLGVVVEATKEVSMLENLKEKQFEEYRLAEQKSEEKFIEEYVSGSSFYKN